MVAVLFLMLLSFLAPPFAPEVPFPVRISDVFLQLSTTSKLLSRSLAFYQWEILMELSKYPLSESDLLFSKKLESVRKDVECFFGILKGRFRTLELAYQKQ